MKEVKVLVKGPGAGREAAIRSLQAAGLGITAIKDVTADPAQRMPTAQAAARLRRSGVWPDTRIRFAAVVDAKAASSF